MTITYVGDLSLGAVLPAPVAVAAAGTAGINLALPDIQARLDALLAFSPAPVDFTAQLTLANQLLASINLAISLGIPPPSIAFQIAEVTALINQLIANIGAINVQLAIITDFQALLSAPGVHTYAYAGRVDQFGPEFSAELATGVPGGTPADPSNALVLITTIGSTWAAMEQVFKVAP